MVSERIRAARRESGKSLAEFAALLSGILGWKVSEAALSRWEEGATPPADVPLAVDIATGGCREPPGMLLDAIPHSFPAQAIAGPWVTTYQFTSAGQPRFHADIAHVTAVSERQVRIVNYPPEPRTQGRAAGFRNEIEARLFSRHLIGYWKNLSDTRYFGAVQLAVRSGETVMEGYYTGFGSDVEVSTACWKWARLEPGADGLPGITLREPQAVYDLVMNRSSFDGPLTVADVREAA